MSKFNSADRQRMADAGVARPDGSYPIPDCQSARAACMDFVRAKGTPSDRAHIESRIKALHCSGPFVDAFMGK